MKIIFKTKNLKLTPEIKEFIEEKINSLEKFLKINENYYNGFFGKGKPKIEIWLEIGRESRHHQKGNVFRAEAQLRLPGKSIRSEAMSENLKTAITEVKDELQREIKQYKARTLKASPILRTLPSARTLKASPILRTLPSARTLKASPILKKN